MVRRDFVKALLSRKALPKNAHRLIAHTIAHSNYILGKALNKTSLTAELLGTGDGRCEFKAYVDKPSTKPETVTLATMITACEGNIDRTSWRSRHGDTQSRCAGDTIHQERQQTRADRSGYRHGGPDHSGRRRH